MKTSAKPSLIRLAVLSAGGAGLMIRALLYALATDEKGLLVRNHPLSVLLTALSIGVLAGIFLLTRPIQGPEAYGDCFHPSIPGGIGCLAAAGGILLSTLAELSAPADSVSLVLRALGFLATGCMLAAALGRMMGARSSFLLYAAVSLYFCLQMVSQYRVWSNVPQIQDYVFQLLACTALMVTAYHHAAFGVDMGRHRSLWFFSLITAYLCMLSLAGPDNQLFYLGTGIWAFTNVSSLAPRKRRQRPDLHLEEQGPEEV